MGGAFKFLQNIKNFNDKDSSAEFGLWVNGQAARTGRPEKGLLEPDGKRISQISARAAASAAPVPHARRCTPTALVNRVHAASVRNVPNRARFWLELPAHQAAPGAWALSCPRARLHAAHHG